MEIYIQMIYRTVILYSVVLIILRLMGKREIGKLSPFDLVIAIIIAELAAIPMEDTDTPLAHGIIPIMVLGLLEVSLSLIALKNMAFRNIVYGKPQIVIARGEILMEEMRKARYNLTDLLSQMREQGYANVDDVEFGILEGSGKLSILPKPNKRWVTPEDLGLKMSYEGVPVPVIMDGHIMKAGLKITSLDKENLMIKLKAQGYHTTEDILFATINADGNLSINPKNMGKTESDGYLG